MKIKPWMRTAAAICLYLFLAGMIVVGISEKRNLHTDEVLTYILANNSYDQEITLAPELGKTYEPASAVWEQVMTVQPEHRFDYQNVWEKQAADVHPPLYYTLVHTICSLFPGTYSKWYAAAVNLVFGLLTLFVMRRLLRELTDQEWIVFLCTGFFCLSSGVLSSMTFLRMYVMTMFWCTLFTLLFVKYKDRTDWKFYAKVILVAVAGAMTHYYFVVYLFSVCLVWGILLLCRHRLRDLGISIGSMLIAGILTILLFPASLEQSLGDGYRGIATIHNLTDSSVVGMEYRLKSCYHLVDQQLFGKSFCLLLLLTVVGVGILLFAGKGKKPFSFMTTDQLERWVLAVVPCVLYFLLVSKMAVYITDRYFHPVYPLLMILGAALPLVLFSAAGKGKKALISLFCLVLLGATLLHWKDNWNYLYRSTGSFLQSTAQYQDKDVLCVFEYAFELPAVCCEAQNYKNITFLTTRDLEQLEALELEAKDGLVLILGHGCEQDAVFAEMTARWEELERFQELGSYSSTTTFYVSP